MPKAVAVNGHQWEIHVDGVICADELDDLSGLDVSVQPATTVLSGRLQDAAALHGILNRLQSLGLHLVEVRQLPDPGAPEPG